MQLCQAKKTVTADLKSHQSSSKESIVPKDSLLQVNLRSFVLARQHRPVLQCVLPWTRVCFSLNVDKVK